MSKATQYIIDYNALQGRVVAKSVLKALHSKAKGVKGAEGVYSRTGEALKAMGSKYSQVLMEFKPLPLPSGEPAPEKKAKLKKRKRKKVQRLEGVMDAGDLRAMEFEEIELSGRYKDEFVKLYSDTQIMIWGRPTHGKTVYLLLFTKYLALEQNLKVLFVANEEIGRSTLKQKLDQFDIPKHANLKFVSDFEQLKKAGYKIEDFDVIVLDSVQTLDMKLKDYTDLVRAHPGRIFIPVVQATKDGEFRGGLAWEHEVDICGQVYNRKLKLSKNRLDPDNAMKNEQFLFDSQVEEALKRRQIASKVKTEIQPKEIPAGGAGLKVA